MKMIESEGRTTLLQTIQKAVNHLRQRQRTLNSAFKISYKKVLRKNHTSRVSLKPSLLKLFKLFKKNQLKRQKSLRQLPISATSLEIEPKSQVATKKTEASQLIRDIRADISRSECQNSIIRTQAPQQFIQVTNLAETGTTGVTHMQYKPSGKLSQLGSRHSFPGVKPCFKPPFLQRHRSEKIISQRGSQQEEGGPQSAKENQILKQIGQVNLRVSQKELVECEEEYSEESIRLLRGIRNIRYEDCQVDFEQAFHERNLERVSWRRPGKSTFFFNRFTNEEEIPQSKRQCGFRDELSSAASSEDIVL